jgi:hypothetical protein
MQRYWGLWSDIHWAWLKDSTGRLIFYPSEKVAKAHAKEYSKIDSEFIAKEYV